MDMHIYMLGKWFDPLFKNILTLKLPDLVQSAHT